MMAVLYGVFVFALVFGADFAWTWWTRRCNEGKPIQAATASVLIYLMGGITIMSYIEHPWMLIPACIGAFVGTLAAMKWLPEENKK